MKHIYFVLLFLINVFSYAQLRPTANLQAYYSGINFSDAGTTLLENLAVKTISKHDNILSYSQRHQFLYDADEDPSNTSNVLLMYTGKSQIDHEWLSGSNPNQTQTFNTEHIYPQSLINATAKADLHHLRTCNININSSRENKPFADVSVSSNYQNLGDRWFPGDEWKGDVARMIMYLNLRYNASFDAVGNLALFLKWNVEDPVSDFEINRQTIISGAQGNRNPFIDNPYLATLIWGGAAAENRWESVSVLEFSVDAVKIYPNPVKGMLLNIEVIENTRYEIYDVLGKKILTGKVTPTSQKVDVSNLNKGVYILKLDSSAGSISKKLIKS